MKGAIFIAALLVLSLFAGAMVIAKQGSDDLDDESDDSDSASLTSSDVAASVGFESDDIDADIDAKADVPSNWKSFPAEVTLGDGWATMNRNGYFARIAYVSKEFANPATDSTAITEVIHGRLKVGNDNYKISARQTETEDDSEDDSESITFEVMKGGENVGTFELHTTSELQEDFKLQEGTLTLDDGKTYQLFLATDEKNVRKATARDRTLQVSRSDKSLDDSDDASDAAEREAKEARKAAKRWWEFWKSQDKEDRSGSNSGSGGGQGQQGGSGSG